MVWPAIIAAGAAVAGGILGNRAAAGQASQNRDFQADQYARRYQITMADMRQAGLNPMLAYSQGPGSSPSGSTAAQGDFGGSAASNALSQMKIRSSQTKVNISSAKNLQADTKLKAEQTKKVKEETHTEFQRRQHVGAQAALTESQNRRIDSEIKSITAKTNLTRDQQRLLKTEIIRMIKTGSGPVGKTIDDITKSIPSSAKALGRWLRSQFTITKD